MKYLRLLLWPFALIYGVVVVIRNWCYDAGWLKSAPFNLPVISIGNLAIGGAGKSPMTEYLVRLLKPYYRTATLSRGYGRKTKGFLLAKIGSTAQEVGDEPAQFKYKFPDVTVAVCEDRVTGVTHLKEDNDIILLDDAFQHRAIQAGLSLLLFDYNQLNDLQLLLPAGNLREPLSSKMRADILIVTKCPADLSQQKQEKVAEKLKPYPYQHLFFTEISYQPLQNFVVGGDDQKINPGATVFLLTGIAGSAPLKQYLTGQGYNVIHHKYPDHHIFTLKNIIKLADEFEAHPSVDKIIVTTEKDAERLKQPELITALSKLPITVQPIAVEFLNGDHERFNKLIKNYVRKYTTHGSVH